MSYDSWYRSTVSEARLLGFIICGFWAEDEGRGVGAASAGFGALTAGSATTFSTFVSMTFSVKII
jgi:hypothetical protein